MVMTQPRSSISFDYPYTPSFLLAPHNIHSHPSLSVSMSFHGIPRELRNLVYAHTAIPIDTYFSANHGLYLSSLQVRAEMDEECGRILASYLNSMQAKIRSNVGHLGTGPFFLEK